MTDLFVATSPAGSPSTQKAEGTAKSLAGGPERLGYRAARFTEIPLLHQRLMEAIETSPFYNDAFKTFETQRLTEAYLGALHAADPYHLFLPTYEGEIAGFMISGPEMGTLWLYWSYLFPELRKSGVAMASMRQFVAHWDHGRFHKVSTYTRPDNKIARRLMERYGYTLTVTLKQHMFGDDFMLYEHPLTKTVPGYDHGTGIGIAGRVRYFFKSLVTI